KAVAESKICKTAKATDFSENDRWDVTRFWTEEELVLLGHKEPAVPRLDFIDETQNELQEITEALQAARKELSVLASTSVVVLDLGDKSQFVVRSGTRVTGKEIRQNPG